MGVPTDEQPANDEPSGRPVKPAPSTFMSIDEQLRAPVPDQEIQAGLSQDHKAEVLAAEENLRRRGADRELVQDMSMDGFAGPRYEKFANDVARYGLSVMRGWLHSGHAFKLAAGRGFSLRPSSEEMDALVHDSDLRDELSTMTVAAALPQFRARALVQSGWTFEGGASLTTYFMGACVFAFPNELRRHRVQQARWRQQDGATPAFQLERGAVNDTAVLATAGCGCSTTSSDCQSASKRSSRQRSMDTPRQRWSSCLVRHRSGLSRLCCTDGAYASKRG